MYIQDLFNPNQKKKLKGNKLVDNSKNLNSVTFKDILPINVTEEIIWLDLHTIIEISKAAFL